MPLKKICSNWNELYSTEVKKEDEKAKIVSGKVNLHEDQEEPNCFTDLNFSVDKAISFPSRSFCSFDHWKSLSKKNCDGAYLVKNIDNTYDLVLIELKSKFDTDEIFQAKDQIVTSYIKLNILLKSSKYFGEIQIRKSYGIIVSLAPEQTQLTKLKHLLICEESKLGKKRCGIVLLKNKYIKAETNECRFSTNIVEQYFDIYYYPSNSTKATIDLEEVTRP